MGIGYYEYFRNCVVPYCTKSAHWENICDNCKKHACSIHYLPNQKLCVICWKATEEEKREYVKKRKSYKKKVIEKSEKSEIDNYFDSQFFNEIGKKKDKRS